ncbi:reverse transcriptase domain-containing protein [Tanacetum coccineum]
MSMGSLTRVSRHRKTEHDDLIGKIVTYRFTLTMLSALRHSGNENVKESQERRIIIKAFKSKSQEKYEHVDPKVTSAQDGKDYKMAKRDYGATYQRLIDGVFNNQISRNLEVYVDDMVIKSDSKEDMLVDIQETFDKLRAINMKLNPRKCSFGIVEGPFLGHFITKQGIKANPSTVKAISDLKPPKTVKEIETLNKKLAALS